MRENQDGEYRQDLVCSGLGMISVREYEENIAECTAGVKKILERNSGDFQFLVRRPV